MDEVPFCRPRCGLVGRAVGSAILIPIATPLPNPLARPSHDAANHQAGGKRLPVQAQPINRGVEERLGFGFTGHPDHRLTSISSKTPARPPPDWRVIRAAATEIDAVSEAMARKVTRLLSRKAEVLLRL